MQNLIPALILFLLSAVTLYAIWYIIRGRRRGQVTPAVTGNETETTGEKKDPVPIPQGKKKYNKKDYCYPTINDVMGYEFVDVVTIPDDLRPNTDKPVSWHESTGIGMQTEKDDENEVKVRVETASTNGPDDSDFDNDINEPEREPMKPLKTTTVEQGRMDEEPATDSGNEGSDNEEDYEDELSPDEYEALQNGAADVSWPVRDDNNIYDTLLDENPNLIEQEKDNDEEAEKIASEIKEIEYYRQLNDQSNLMEMEENAASMASQLLDD